MSDQRTATCSNCNGSGWEVYPLDGGEGYPCPQCEGTGAAHQPKDRCEDCFTEREFGRSRTAAG